MNPSSDIDISSTVADTLVSFRGCCLPDPSVIVNQTVHYNATLDRTFFALSDPTRREILDRLARAPATLSELAAPFGLTLNGVKKHVGILEDVDLVTTTKVGRARVSARSGAAQRRGAVDRGLSTQLGATARPLRHLRRGAHGMTDDVRYERI